MRLKLRGFYGVNSLSKKTTDCVGLKSGGIWMKITIDLTLLWKNCTLCCATSAHSNWNLQCATNFKIKSKASTDLGTKQKTIAIRNPTARLFQKNTVSVWVQKASALFLNYFQRFVSLKTLQVGRSLGQLVCSWWLRSWNFVAAENDGSTWFVSVLILRYLTLHRLLWISYQFPIWIPTSPMTYICLLIFLKNKLPHEIFYCRMSSKNLVETSNKQISSQHLNPYLLLWFILPWYFDKNGYLRGNSLHLSVKNSLLHIIIQQAKSFKLICMF